MLQETQDIVVGAIHPPTNETSPSCELMICGRPSGHRVEGCVFEAAIKYDSGYLIFLTNDIPFEDSLNIHLLSHSGLLRDTASLFWIYCTGSFEDLKIELPDKVSFRFLGDMVWRVQVLPKPILRIPFFSEPTGVHRPFGFKRHFVVSANSKPDFR